MQNVDDSNHAKAHFEHDCYNCKFLGHFDNCDLYFCPQPKLGGDVLARYGDDASEYASLSIEIFAYSGPLKGTHGTALMQCCRRAIKLFFNFDYLECLKVVKLTFAEVEKLPVCQEKEMAEWFDNQYTIQFNHLFLNAHTYTDPIVQIATLYTICHDIITAWQNELGYNLRLSFDDGKICVQKVETDLERFHGSSFQEDSD